MTLEEKLEAIGKLIINIDEYEPMPDDWCAVDVGNYDDAFYLGQIKGQEYIASEIRKILTQPL